MEKFILFFRGGAHHAYNANESKEGMEIMQQWMNWMGGLQQKGILVAADPLLPTGKQVIGAGKRVAEGPYVQEGEQLAVISDISSFVFILNLPYELRPYVMNSEVVQLILPDGKILFGRIASSMPVVDSASQTQNIVLKVSEKNLPVNLIAKVRVAKTVKAHAISLPKQSVLSDETQTDFWVMKLIDDSTAIKVPIEKGMEIDDRIEILKPEFINSDRFLLTGNYGLADTARIKIVKE